MVKKLAVLLILFLFIGSIAVAKELQQAQYTIEYSNIYDPPDQKMPSQQVWRKGEKSRREWKEGSGEDKVTMVVIIKDGYVFTYSPQIKNSATKMTKGPDNIISLFYDADNPFVFRDSFSKIGAKLVKSEVLRGYTCDVYEINSENDINRYWIWKDENFPIRMETESQGKIVSSLDYKGIQLNAEIDDKLFDLPEGVEFREEEAPRL